MRSTLLAAAAFTSTLLLIASNAHSRETGDDIFAARWQPWIGIGGSLGHGRSIGETNLFIPIWQNDRSMALIDLRGSFDNHSATEGNFGLGFRHMLDNDWNLGLYGYYDRRHTSTGRLFNQATLGFEANNSWLDFRVNGYLPFGKTEQSTSTFFTTSSTTGIAVVTGTTLGIISTTTTQGSELINTERAMAGFDGELGVKIPLFPDHLKLDLKAYIGGYHFDASGADNFSGPRARLDLTQNDFAGLAGAKLTTDVSWQDDRRGDQWRASARLTIPLGAPQSHQSPLTEQEERMLQPILRDVDIVAGSKTHSENVDKTTTRTESAINTWNNKKVASIVSVDALEGGATIQAEMTNQQNIAGADSSVIVLNGALTYTDGLAVSANQTLLGGGTTLKLRGASTGVEVDYITSGATGSISGNGESFSSVGHDTLIRLNENSVVGGLTLTQTSTFPINSVVGAFNADGAVAFNNTITGSNGTTSIGIRFDGSSNATAYANTINAGTGTQSDGLFATRNSRNILFDSNDITVQGNTAATVVLNSNSSAIIRNNRLNASGVGDIIWLQQSSAARPGSTGNTIVGSYGEQCVSAGTSSSGTVSFINAADCVYP